MFQKHFLLFQLIHTIRKDHRMLKQIKIITLAPTCFGSRRNHYQGAVLCLVKTTKYSLSVLVFIDVVNIMTAYQPVVKACGERHASTNTLICRHNTDYVDTDEHGKTIFVVLAKHRTAPWWRLLREPKRVGASVIIFIFFLHFYDFIIVCISWTNKKCFWYYWLTVQAWSYRCFKRYSCLYLHIGEVLYLNTVYGNTGYLFWELNETYKLKLIVI
jgi:hypothetical protein